VDKARLAAGLSQPFYASAVLLTTLLAGPMSTLLLLARFLLSATLLLLARFLLSATLLLLARFLLSATLLAALLTTLLLLAGLLVRILILIHLTSSPTLV